jgi:radical SAM superfamily enzyme YgiQ (UPF0313 family)
MRVTFVRPSITGRRAFDAMEPLAFAVLAAHTPGDVEVAFFDERIEPIPDDHETDLVALTVETYTARRAYQIASAFRRRGVPVVMGGYHATFVPDEALGYADAVALGDAEPVWPQIVADARRGALARVYRADHAPDLADARYDRSIFRGKRYAPAVPVQYGRGCRYACDFCSIRAFYGSSVRHRPAAEVAAEVERLGRHFVLLVDDNLFVDVPSALELFAALEPLGVRWGCQVSLDVARDATVMDAMRRAGCVAALVGFESLDAASLADMKKLWNLKGGTYREAIDRFHDRGIMIYGSFVFGYDHDARDVFDRTVEFAVEAKLFLVNFSALTPTPGTPLYDRLKAQRRLIGDPWWLDPAYRYGQATFRPARMTADELTEGCLRARREFYSYGSIARRATNLKANGRGPSRIGIFAAANVMTRRELRNKLGQRLGTDAPIAPLVEVPCD